ncbi:MAG: hypothetical protein ABFC96_04405 [Thermoguttaceae bacterium]
MADAAACKPRWYRLTPDRLVLALLAAEGFLLLSAWGRWLPFNQHKGWTVLIAVATAGLTLLLMSLWFLAALLLRCRFQYTLRSLFLLVLTVAIPCSWLATEMKAARRQRELRVALEAVASISFAPTSHRPLWLRRWLGDDFFATVHEVRRGDLFGGVIFPPSLRPQEPFDLRLVREFVDLRVLEVSGEPVTDSDLKHLQRMPALEELDLSKTKVTDDGLAHLRGLQRLEILRLQLLDLTDAGLENLSDLHELEELVINGPRITDAGLANLKGLTRLKRLWLVGTGLKGPGIRFLAKLPELTELNLAATQITDSELEHVKCLKHLNRLGLLPDESRLTAKGVNTLMKSLPNCQLMYKQGELTPAKRNRATPAYARGYIVP